MLRHPPDDLGTKTAARVRLVRDQQPAGLGDGGQDGLQIERHDRARIDDLHVDLAGKRLGGRQRLVNHVRGCHDRQVAPFPADRGLAQRDGPF